MSATTTTTPTTTPTMHIGYKALKDHKIAKLQILGPNNEGRVNIVDPNRAKYRCESAKVLSIYHVATDEQYVMGESMHDKNFVYKVGEVVSPTEPYDEDIKKTCSSGIHYYLTEDEARNHSKYVCTTLVTVYGRIGKGMCEFGKNCPNKMKTIYEARDDGEIYNRYCVYDNTIYPSYKQSLRSTRYTNWCNEKINSN